MKARFRPSIVVDHLMEYGFHSLSRAEVCLLRRIAVALFTAVFCMSSFGIAWAGTTGGLRGRILDRDTQKGIAGVKVTVASPSQTATSTTDANGAFVFISLIPDTYTMSVQPPGYDAATQAGITIIADQVQQASLTPGRLTATIGRTASRAPSLVKSGVTGDVYSVNAVGAEAAQTLGGAGSINQAYGAMASVPGVSLQMGQQGWNQAVYVRGGDYEDVAYELDGIPVQRASDGAPITTLTNLGQGELQVYTGGAPASADASGLSGYVNQVVRSGTAPGFADLQFGVGGAALYNKVEGEVGGASQSGNFTYYLGALAVDQGYRYGDNFNGASDPLYFYPLGTNLNGNFVASPGQSYSIASTSDREVIGNFHYYIKHKHDDGRDDIQFLYANGRIFAPFYSSVNDIGGPAAVSSVIGNTYGYGAPQPAYWQDAYVYTGALMQPLNPNDVATYSYPSSPQHAFQAPLPDGKRDTNDNNFAIAKLQWQRNIDDHSYLRLFAYTSYNNWFINGPVSNNLPYAGEIADYEVNGHTYGLNARYEYQIDVKNLITATASFQTQKSETYDSSNDGQIDENLVDAHGNCLGPTGAYVSCFVPVSQGGGLNLVSQYGSTPVTTPPYAALPGSQWIVTQNGYNAQIGLVNPYFSAASVGDEFRPTDKLLINAGIRFEDYDYKLIDTQVGPAETFWFNAWNRENCYYPGSTAPVNSSATLDATGTYTACGAGAVPLLNTSPATANYTAWQPRVSATYTFTADTVVRASLGRYAQQPGGEYLQYNTIEQNSTTLLQNFLPYGFNTPFHSTAPSYSDSYDFSLEHHFKGTDLSFKLTPFYRVTQNVEQDIPIGTQGVVDGLNTGTGQSKGVEFELTKGDFSKNGVSFQLAYTFTNTGTTFGNFPGSSSNFIDNLNTYIQQYNAFTSACAPGGKDAGSKLCGSTPSGAIAAPAYDASGNACASATVAGCTANPYYDVAPQALFDRTGTYTPYDILPSNPYYGDVGFVTPTVVTAIVNYRHGKFAFTPSGTYTSGTFYGAPLSTPGYDPSTCATPGVITSCSGQIFIPDQYSGVFDKQGQFEEPTRFTLNLQTSYEFSRHVRLVVAATGIIDHCYQRGYAWDNPSTCVYAQLPSNGLGPVGNTQGPVSSAPIQLQYPYGSFYNNVQTGFSGQKMPLSFFANLEFRL